MSEKAFAKEIFSFEYTDTWVSAQNPILHLDPHLGFYKGKQYLPEEKNNFGIFLDSSPDRWGRLLMRRREAWQAKAEGRDERTLFESDFLLGVFDGHRMGGIRFKLGEDGPFMNDQKKMFRINNDIKMENYLELSNPLKFGKFFYCSNSGHMIPKDDPEIIISSIKLALQDYDKNKKDRETSHH